MRINNINNLDTNTSFKELRLKRGAEQYISTVPKNVSEKLNKIKEELADTKFFHLDIGKDCFYICQADGEKFYQPFIITKAGKVLLIKSRQGLSQISKKLKYVSAEKVKKIYERITKQSTQIERTAEIVKVLDEYEKEVKKIC